MTRTHITRTSRCAFLPERCWTSTVGPGAPDATLRQVTRFRLDSASGDSGSLGDLGQAAKFRMLVRHGRSLQEVKNVLLPQLGRLEVAARNRRAGAAHGIFLEHDGHVPASKPQLRRCRHVHAYVLTCSHPLNACVRTRACGYAFLATLNTDRQLRFTTSPKACRR